MLNFKNLNSAKEKTKDRDEKNNENYSLAYSEALNYLEKFKHSPDFDKNILKKAADKLIDALEYKKNKAEPYICLACIFYILNDSKMAIKYLKIANLINSHLPEISKLRELFGSGQ